MILVHEVLILLAVGGGYISERSRSSTGSITREMTPLVHLKNVVEHSKLMILLPPSLETQYMSKDSMYKPGGVVIFGS